MAKAEWYADAFFHKVGSIVTNLQIKLSNATLFRDPSKQLPQSVQAFAFRREASERRSGVTYDYCVGRGIWKT